MQNVLITMVETGVANADPVRGSRGELAPTDTG